MEISYKREMNHNYMIITPDETVEDGYETRMLAGNQIDGLLKFRIRHWEDKKEYYYEITSRQPLSRLLERKKITGEEIRKLLLGIAASLNRIEDYLLKEGQILLEPEYIYIEPDTFSSGLCMVPGYACDFPAHLTGLLQYLLEKVDHEDKDGVVLAYNLYHESLKENYGMVDLLRLLSPESLSKKEDRERRGNTRLPFPEMEEEEKNYFPDAHWEQEQEDRKNMNFRPGDERGGVYRQPSSVGVVRAEKEGDRKREDIKAVKSRCAPGSRKTAGHSAAGNREAAENKGAVGGREAAENKGMAVSKKAVPWGSILLFAGAEEAAIWFLAGEEVLFQYGVAAGVLTIVCAGAVFLLRGKHQPPYSGEWMDYPRKEPLCEDWNLTIEEEAEEKKKEEIVSKENQEIETVLLAEKKDGQKLAFLESVSRERESIEVPYIPFVIGKHEELADYCLRHPTVSRLHIRLDQKEGVFIVTDLNSTNGTIVDQYHLQSNETVSIKNGDRLCLADLEYRFWEK